MAREFRGMVRRVGVIFFFKYGTVMRSYRRPLQPRNRTYTQVTQWPKYRFRDELFCSTLRSIKRKGLKERGLKRDAGGRNQEWKGT